VLPLLVLVVLVVVLVVLVLVVVLLLPLLLLLLPLPLLLPPLTLLPLPPLPLPPGRNTLNAPCMSLQYLGSVSSAHDSKDSVYGRRRLNGCCLAGPTCWCCCG
jgi:hypothetical protein